MIDARHILNCYESRDRESLERYLNSLPKAVGVQDVLDGERYRQIRRDLCQVTGVAPEKIDSKVDSDIRKAGA